MTKDQQTQAQQSGHDIDVAREELDSWQCAGIAALDPGREALAEMIKRRVRGMFSSGLVDEVVRIRELGYGEAGVVRNGIGYREAGQAIDDELSIEQAIERTIVRTRQYAKRQRTYFRGRGWPILEAGSLGEWARSIELDKAN